MGRPHCPHLVHLNALESAIVLVFELIVSGSREGSDEHIKNVACPPLVKDKRVSKSKFCKKRDKNTEIPHLSE